MLLLLLRSNVTHFVIALTLEVNHALIYFRVLVLNDPPAREPVTCTCAPHSQTTSRRGLRRWRSMSKRSHLRRRSGRLSFTSTPPPSPASLICYGRALQILLATSRLSSPKALHMMSFEWILKIRVSNELAVCKVASDICQFLSLGCSSANPPRVCARSRPVTTCPRAGPPAVISG